VSTSSGPTVIRAPGRLIVAPTTAFATGTFPFGGTEVGKVRACALMPAGRDFPVECEGLGSISDLLEGVNRCVFTCLLRGWDHDAVQLLLADGYVAGAQTQHAAFRMPGTRVPGSSAFGRAVKVALVPDDPAHAVGVLLYRAIPTFPEGASLFFDRQKETAIPIALECLLDDSDRLFKVGKLADLDL
jgi:hypothetical protein